MEGKTNKINNINIFNLGSNKTNKINNTLVKSIIQSNANNHNNTKDLFELNEISNINHNNIINLLFLKSKKKLKNQDEDIYDFSTPNDNSIDNKEINNVPYSQALRIDKRNYIQMLISILANNIKIIAIFYYKNPLVPLSLTISIYLFESLLDLTLNCFLYSDGHISEKYKNGGLKFVTSLLLSFLSNIISSIISYFILQLVDYSELLEMILNNVYKKKYYFLNIFKFKKHSKIKFCCFYLLQFIFNIFMCYYLTIFCIVYHQTQGSIMFNYLIGLGQSLIISLSISIIIAFLRFISIRIGIKNIYNTSKYLHEKF